MKALFTSGDGAEDMISWARKLDGLGAAIVEICQGNKDADYVFPVLGEIIQDYAMAIETVLSENYGSIRDGVGDLSNRDVKEILREYNRYKDDNPEFFRASGFPQETLEKIQAFKEKVAPVFEIEADIKKRLNGSTKKPAKINQASE